MSQYIQGVVDYIPMIQPFQPDFNLFTKVLETKEAGYKAGYDKLSSLYGTLLNSPMSREDNIELRNKFFKDISSQIQKISSLDLSKSQNVEAAYKVFQPLIDDNFILKDMSYTKEGYNELERGESLKNCLDPKKCPGQYWDGGKRLVQYQMQRFKEVSREETLKMENPRFVPKVNLSKQAMDYAKEMGFKVTLPSYSPDGRYDISTTNGPNMIPGLADTFMSVFGDDPAASDYYNALSKLNRNDFAYSEENIQKYGSKEAAEMFYLDEMHRSIVASTAEQLKIAKDQETLASNKKATIDSFITSKGVDPNDPNDQALIKDRYQSMVDQMISGSNAETYESDLSSISDDGFESLDLDSKIYRIDGVTGRSLMQRALYQAANDYAMQTMEVKRTVNEFALKDYDNMLAIRRMAIQDKYARDLYQYQKSVDIVAESFKKKNGATPDGRNPDDLGFRKKSPSPGGSALKVDLQGEDVKVVQQATDQAMLEANDVLEKGYSEFMSIIETPNGSFTSGGVKMTDEVRNYYRGEMLKIFGVGKVETVKTTVSNNQTGSYPTGSTLLVSGVLPYKEEKQVDVSVVKGGQLREDGTRLHGNFMDHIDFANSASDQSWEKTAEKLTKFFKTDTLGSRSVEYNPQTGLYGAIGKYESSKVNYDNYIKSQIGNNQIVHDQLMSSAAGNAVIDELSKYNPTEFFANSIDAPPLIVEHTKASLEKMVTKGGALLTMDQFKELYANSDAAREVAKKVVEDVYNTPSYYEGDLLQYGYAESVETVLDLLKGDAEDVYTEYMDQFTKIYNQDTDAAVKDADKKGFVPISAFYNFNDSGSGIQSDPYGATVDSAYPGSVQAIFFRDLYDNYISQNKDNDAIEVYAGSGGNLTERRMFRDDEDPVDDKAQYLKALEGLRAELMFNREADNDKRALFEFDVHPIILNDPNKVGFSFSANPQYYDANKGTTNSGKYMSGSGDTFTMVIDKNKLPEIKNAEVLKVLNQGRYTIEMRANKKIDINQYPLGGTATITPFGNNSYKSTRTVNFIDQDTFKIRQYTENDYMGPGEDLENFAQRSANVLATNAHDIQLAQEQIRAINSNLVKDPSTFDNR